MPQAMQTGRRRFLNVCIFALLVLLPVRIGYEEYVSRIRFRLIPFVW